MFPVLQVPAQTLTLPQMCSTASPISKCIWHHPDSSICPTLPVWAGEPWSSPKWSGTFMDTCRVPWADLPGQPHGCMAKKFCWLPLRLGLGVFLYLVKEVEIREQNNCPSWKGCFFSPWPIFWVFKRSWKLWGGCVALIRTLICCFSSPSLSALSSPSFPTHLFLKRKVGGNGKLKRKP